MTASPETAALLRKAEEPHRSTPAPGEQPGERLVREARTWVASHPGWALGVAVGAGFLLGRWLKR